MLYGYGGFNIAQQPAFSVPALVWLEMGGVYAVANLRGGSEYGEAWHSAGTRSQKQNVFDDFIAAAEWLIAEKYTSTPKLAIRGRSNGGLLVGAALTQRPDLFGATLPAVGVLDMLRYHTASANARQWSTDYGLSENAAEFKAQYAYSPVHNVKHGHLLSADAGDDGRSRRSRRAVAQLQVRGGAAAGAGLRESRCCCESRHARDMAPASQCGCRSRTSPISGRFWFSHCRCSETTGRLTLTADAGWIRSAAVRASRAATAQRDGSSG